MILVGSILRAHGLVVEMTRASSAPLSERLVRIGRNSSYGILIRGLLGSAYGVLTMAHQKSRMCVFVDFQASAW